MVPCGIDPFGVHTWHHGWHTSANALLNQKTGWAGNPFPLARGYSGSDRRKPARRNALQKRRSFGKSSAHERGRRCHCPAGQMMSKETGVLTAACGSWPTAGLPHVVAIPWSCFVMLFPAATHAVGTRCAPQKAASMHERLLARAPRS